MEDTDYFTLRKICAKKIANYIGNGTLQKFKLEDAKMSNLIFSYCLGNRDFNEQFFGNVAKCLNVTEVKHNRDDVWRMDGKLTYYQNIESLSLMNLRKWKRFHTHYDDKPGSIYAAKDLKRRPFYAVKLVKTLKLFVNRYSRKKLKSLTIHPDYCEFHLAWMKSIYHCFPSLTTLNLEACLIGDEEFQNYISGFRHLTRLDLHDCNLSSLRGISVLEDLEYLDITGIEVEDPEEIQELGSLQKLKTLLVATIYEEQKGVIMKFCVDLKFSFPNLEIVDCSFNKIDNKDFQKWSDRHKKLTTVCVVGSPITEFSLYVCYPDRNLITLNSRSLSECLDSLKHYISTYRNIPGHILNFMFNRLIELVTKVKGYIYPPSDLRECLDFMCVNRGRLGTGVVEVIYALVAKRHTIFSKKDLDFVYNILVKEDFAFELQKVHFTEIDHQITIWKLLCEEGIFEQERLIFLHNTAFRLLSESEELNPEVARIAFNFFWKNLKTFQGSIPLKPLYESDFIPSVLWFLKDAEITSEETKQNFQELIDLIQKIFGLQESEMEPRETIDQEIVRHLWSHIPKFREDESIRMDILNTLMPLVFDKVEHFRGVFLEPETMESMLPLLFSNSTTNEAIFIFIKIVEWYHESIPGSVDLETHFEEICSDLNKSIVGYVDTGKPGFYDKLSWILTHCRSVITEEFVGRFYQHFLDLEADS